MSRFPVRKKIRLPLAVYNQKYVYFVTISTYRKHEWFRLHPDLNDIAVQVIRASSSALETKLFAWCIMPDHIHLLIQGRMPIEFILRIKGKMTPFARTIDPGKRLWQRSFFDHALRSEESLFDVACYIWENPVRANLVDNPGEFIWSGSDVWLNWRNYYGRG
jgi:putative transposase